MHLLSRGCVMPILKYIKDCWQKETTDVSLIRHFVSEVMTRRDGCKSVVCNLMYIGELQVLDVVTSPYSNEFIQLFLPLVENSDITGSLKSDEKQRVSEFIGTESFRATYVHMCRSDVLGFADVII